MTNKIENSLIPEHCNTIDEHLAKNISVILLVVAIVVGVIFTPFVCPTYWDEIAQYTIGEYNLNQYTSLFDKIFGTELADPGYADFEHFADRDYGSIFEVLVSLLGKVAAKTFRQFDFADFIILKHFSVYFVFVLGTYGVYSIARRRLGSQYGGLLAAAVFFLSPRLFGNAFYNSKDIVFLSFFVLSVNYVLQAAYCRRMKTLILAAVFTALAVSARFIGIFSLLLGIFVWSVTWRRNGCSVLKIYTVILKFAVFTFILIYIFYPFLWPSPLQRASEVISNMSTFVRHGDDGLFDGEWVHASQKPFYLMNWMAITLPFLFIIVSLCGQVPALLLMIKRTFSLSLWRNKSELYDYVTVVLGLAPVLVSLVKHPWIYDSWRHFYFLIPFLSVSAAVGIFRLAFLFKSQRARIVLVGWLSLFVIIESLYGIFWFFPYPNCYFNSSAGSNLISRYDFDYSATAAHEALVKIISLNPQSAVSVSPDRSALFRERLGMAGNLLHIEFNDKFPDYIVTSRSVLTNTENKLYHEVYAVRTVGGEVVVRILAPNNDRDNFCRLHEDECDFVW